MSAQAGSTPTREGATDLCAAPTCIVQLHVRHVLWIHHVPEAPVPKHVGPAKPDVLDGQRQAPGRQQHQHRHMVQQVDAQEQQQHGPQGSVSSGGLVQGHHGGEGHWYD
jgi:hypothetical protein